MKIGVVGLGSIGNRHLRNLLALQRNDLVLCDTNEAIAQATRKEFGILTYTDTALLWDRGIKCVLICTPPASHLELAIEAFRHGCATFIEKPLGTVLAGWKELGQEFDSAHLINMVGCNWRFAHGPRQIKDWLATGVLGEILSARLYCGYSIDDRPGYRRSYVASTGAILDVGAHLLDLALDWFGPCRLASSVARSANSIGLPKVDGCADVLLAHESGATSSIHVNLLQRHYRHAVEVTGREGIIGYDFSMEHIYSRLWGKPYEDYRWRDEPDMFEREIQHFLDCCESRKSSCNPILQNIDVLNLLLSAKRVRNYA